MQYLRFLGDLARGDLGVSMINGTPVRDQVAYNLPFTLQLTLAALAVGIVLGVPVGILTAVERNRAADYIGRVLSLAGLSVPAFYLGILLILLFGVQLKWLPAIGGGNPNTPLDLVAYLVLPALTLGLVMTASVARLSRSAMLERADPGVRAHRARQRPARTSRADRAHAAPGAAADRVADRHLGGGPDRRLGHHRAGLLPPGLGKMMVGAMLQRDYTVAPVGHGRLHALRRRHQPAHRPGLRPGRSAHPQ